MRFTLPQQHKDKDSTKCRQHPCSITTHAHRREIEHPQQPRLIEQQVKQGVLEGSIPSVVWDKACTYHAEMVGDPFIQTYQRSNKIFTLTDGHPTPETNIAKL